MKIKDRMIAPYIIEVDEHNYVVKEDVVSKAGKESERIHGYFHELSSAVQKVIKLKALEEREEATLLEYVANWVSIQDRIIKELKRITL